MPRSRAATPAQDPLALLLHAQSAQLDGDRAGAQRAFRAMAEREDTRLLGLRGLFIEAQRADDPVAAVVIAEEALKLAPASTWASQAVLGFRCAKGDWSGALAILDNNLASGLIDKAAYRRQRGVLLTARALELETVDRDRVARQRDGSDQAGADPGAGRGAGRANIRARRIRCAVRCASSKRHGWRSRIPISPMPMPMSGSAIPRGSGWCGSRPWRPKRPAIIESALALARAAIDATEFARAREALAPFIDAPTQRVAMLMAEIERTEHGDSGRARAWTLRAVRALHDPVWTADGYVSSILAAGVAGQSAGSTPSSGRRRWRRCRRTRPPRSSPRLSRKRCWRRAREPVAKLESGAAIRTGGRAGSRPGRTRCGRACARRGAGQCAARGDRRGAGASPGARAATLAPMHPPPRPCSAPAQDIPKVTPQNIPGRDSDRAGARRSRGR